MIRLLVIAIVSVLSISRSLAVETVSMHWTSLGKDADAFDSMMERAAFLDVPRRDLEAIVAGGGVSTGSRASRQANARADYWKGWVIASADPDSALTLVNSAIAMCDSVKFPYDMARFSILKADLLRFSGNYADAYFIYRDRIERLRKSDDSFWVGKALVGVGIIMQELGEYHEALRLYTEAQEEFRKAGSFACVTKNRINLANANYLLGDKSKSLAILNNLESSGYVANDSVYIANVLVSRFQISGYSDTVAARRAYDIGLRLNDDKLSVITLMSVGALLYARGDERKAVGFFRNALDKTLALGDIANRKLVLQNMRECYLKLGMSDSAAICERDILSLNDSIYHKENVDNLKRAEHLATIHQFEQRILQEKENHKMRQTLVLAVSGFILVILVLSVCLLLASKRKAESERNLKEEKNRHLTLMNRQYSLEIEAKAKELASNTVLLAQKNAKLKELGQQIRDLEQKGDIAESEGRLLSDKINNELTADDDWRFFKLRFDKVHPCFFSSLKEAFPALSKTELRLCAYIRVGMSAKEIAQLLSIRPETVNTSRYRIRKKMSLKSDDSLESVLENY